MDADRKSLLFADLLQLSHQFGLGLDGQVELVDPVAQIILRQLEAAGKGGDFPFRSELWVVRVDKGNRDG